MKQIVFLFAACCGVTACMPENHSQRIDKLNWILGAWEAAEKDGKFIEAWTKQNDSLFIGNGFFITPENDTPFRETLSIENKNDTLYYIVTTVQNGEVGVRFQEHSMTEETIIFENPKHDFPQQIIYTRTDDKHLVAKITGTQNGKTRTEEFRLKRIPES